jgi:hypothetical protein
MTYENILQHQSGKGKVLPFHAIKAHKYRAPEVQLELSLTSGLQGGEGQLLGPAGLPPGIRNPESLHVASRCTDYAFQFFKNF